MDRKVFFKMSDTGLALVALERVESIQKVSRERGSFADPLPTEHGLRIYFIGRKESIEYWYGAKAESWEIRNRDYNEIYGDI